MRRPYLVADSAEVVVMRSLASTAFGAYHLDLPDGLELGDVWEGDAPGNSPGYVASLDRGVRVGGMFRRFMRADVHITVPGDDPELRAAGSDVEQVLDGARDRTSGEFFLESDIEGAGLGPWVPLQDFVVGDTVDVQVFGAVVPMRVTRVEPGVGSGAWKVHVGGQLVGDDDARIAENEAVYRALVESRRGLAGVEASARGASRAAARAQVSADSALGETQVLRDTLAGDGASSVDVREQLEVLNAQLQERGEAAADGLIPAYIEANTKRWALQDELNAAQARQVDDNRARIVEIRELQGENQNQIEQINILNSLLTRLSVGKMTLMGGETARSNDHGIAVRMPDWDRNLYVVAKGDFVGTVTVQLFYSNGAGYQRVFSPSDFKVGSYSKLSRNSFFNSFMLNDGRFQVAEWFVDLGHVTSATVLVDHTTWTRGVLDEPPLEG